jgi:hypothetical protein
LPRGMQAVRVRKVLALTMRRLFVSTASVDFQSTKVKAASAAATIRKMNPRTTKTNDPATLPPGVGTSANNKSARSPRTMPSETGQKYAR